MDPISARGQGSDGPDAHNVTRTINTPPTAPNVGQPTATNCAVYDLVKEIFNHPSAYVKKILKNTAVRRIRSQPSDLSPENRAVSNTPSVEAVVREVAEKQKFEKVLFLYSSGGGGHISVKNAIRDKSIKTLMEAVKKHLIQTRGEEKGAKIYSQHFPNTKAQNDFLTEKGLIDEQDVLKDYVGWVGKKGAYAWNHAQKTGNIQEQERIAHLQPLASVAFSPIIFIRTLVTLIRFHPDKVVSTQAMSNEAILSAIIIYNVLFRQKTRPKLQLDLYFTDIPTHLANHFVDDIRNMSQNQRDHLVIHAPTPSNDFQWKVKVKVENLEVLDLPIRMAFIESVKTFQDTEFDSTHLQLKVSGAEERNLLEQVIGTHAIKSENKEDTHVVNYLLGEKDPAYFIMLGSQPTESAIQEYIKGYIKHAQTHPTQDLHLFLFTGKYKEKKGKANKAACFYQTLVEQLASMKIPENLKIIPLSFQDADQMVGLFSRCHTITRSGGLPSMIK